MNAVAERGRPLVDDPARLAGVTALGLDETTFLKRVGASPHCMSPAWSTCAPADCSTWSKTAGGRGEEALDFTGEAYIVAVANLNATRITADLDHDGDLFLRQRLAAYITTGISRASAR